MDIYRAAIRRTEDMGSRVSLFYFDKPPGFGWDEGAHVHLALPGFNDTERPDKSLVRHMSILTLVDEQSVGVITRLDSSDSDYKRRLAAMGPGDECYLFKIGSALKLRRDGRPVAILTMGVAIGAARPLAISYAKNPQGIPRMISLTVNRRDDYPFRAEMEGLSAPGLKLMQAKSREAYREALRGLSTENSPRFLIIGSDEFMRESIFALRDKAVSPDDMVVDLKPEKRAALFDSLGLSAAGIQA